jgi:hypothetical protein
MSKDWQTSACTKYRALLFVCLFIPLVVLTFVAFGALSAVMINRQIKEYDNKIEKLKVGMEEKDLIRIMGESQPTRVKSADYEMIPREIREKHEYLVLYVFDLISFYSSSELKTTLVFVDESDRRIVDIREWFSLWLLKGPRADLLLVLALAIEGFLSWLGVRWWCKKRTKLS